MMQKLENMFFSVLVASDAAGIAGILMEGYVRTDELIKNPLPILMLSEALQIYGSLAGTIALLGYGVVIKRNNRNQYPS